MLFPNCVKGVRPTKQGEKTGVTATGVLLLTEEKGFEGEDYEEEAAYRSRKSLAESGEGGKLIL